MSWKKNAFSYILWGIYLLVVSIAFAGIGSVAVRKFEWTNQYVSGIIVVSFFLLIILLYVITRKVIPPNLLIDIDKKKGWKVTRSIIVIGLLALGVFLRIFYISYAGEDAPYFDAAKVTENGSIPMITHGAVYVYLQLLRGLFILVGNKWMAGIWLQIALQILSCILLYFSVRKLAGEIPALIMIAFFMLSPHMIAQGLTYSPQMLYLCIYAIGLLCITDFLTRRAAGNMKNVYDVIFLLFSGLVLGMVCYLDISGISLLVIAFSVFWMEKPEAINIWGNTLLEWFVLLFGTVGFLGCYLAMDAFISGKTFWGVGRAWCTLYSVKGYHNTFWLSAGGDYIVYFILLFILTLGILTFWNRKGYEKISVWVFAVIAIAVMEYFGITTEDIKGFDLFYWMAAALAGIAIAECFHKEQALEENPMKEVSIEEIPIEEVSMKEVFINEMPLEKVSAEEVLIEDITEVFSEPDNIINFIENPLPLPKKIERKPIDFDFLPKNNEMDYDLKIQEFDDFDIT